jgi:MFS family permease
MAARPIAGAVSDRARSRFGRRAPRIAAGALTGGTALVAMAFATSVPAMLAAWCLVHFGYNFATDPLAALMPDRVPVDSRGR